MARSVTLRERCEGPGFRYVNGLIKGVVSHAETGLEDFRRGIQDYPEVLVTHRDTKNPTPLMVLVAHGQIELASMLLDAADRMDAKKQMAGADETEQKGYKRALLDQKDWSGRTALDYADTLNYEDARKMRQMLRLKGADMELMASLRGRTWVERNVDRDSIVHNDRVVPISQRVRDYLEENPE